MQAGQNINVRVLTQNLKIISRRILTLRTTSLCVILLRVYEDEVLPAGRKRGTYVVKEFFQVHFPNSGT